MKKFLLTVTLLFSCVLAFAQVQLSPEGERKCLELTRSMSIKLRLNEAEYIRLKALNRSHVAKTDEILRAYSQDDRLKTEKIAELEKGYEKTLTSFLKPNQLQAYAVYKEEKKVRFMASSEEN
ncbi:hypothetical protein [Pontibacter arcticus]|uniref:Uncharacterized protein n=1 Tax=Pontibacter arcticus TaxID=2080288 RepID=A0A364RBP5_9BACT|nr:hypothetical protein [Pontibacter arcticus]RAU81770.1 hypothetical protein DP923_13800 [Pontibacter arcticus]